MSSFTTPAIADASTTPAPVVIDISSFSTLVESALASSTSQATTTNTVATTTQSKPRPKQATISYKLLNNCYLYIASKVPNLPRMAQMHPNSEPVVGAVAMFNYSGTPHYALVTSVQGTEVTIDETNYHHGKRSQRDISVSDPHLLGFWKG